MRPVHGRPLLDPQRVHIGAEEDGAISAAALQCADDARAADAFGNLKAEGPEALGDERARAALLEAEFGVLMKIAAPVSQLGPEGVGVQGHFGKEAAEGRGVNGRRACMRLVGRGWLIEVMRCVERIGRTEFTLYDVYAFESHLSELYPDNKNVRPKIRQQLPILRDHGWLAFEGKGRYRLASAT
jgi:hypothetical protein